MSTSSMDDPTLLETLPSQVANLVQEHTTMKAEIDRLMHENTELKSKIVEADDKARDIEELKSELATMKAENIQLKNESCENCYLKSKVHEMEQKARDTEEWKQMFEKSMEEKFDKLQQDQKAFYFKASNGNIVSIEDGLCFMTDDQDVALAYEFFFVMEKFGHSKVALKSNGKYVSSEDGIKEMTCDREIPLEWELFELIHHDGNGFSLKGNNGKYVSHDYGHLYCDAANIGEDEIFHRFYDI